MNKGVLFTLVLLGAVAARDGLAQASKSPVQVKIKTSADRDRSSSTKKGELTTTETQNVGFSAFLANPSMTAPAEKIALKLFVVAGSYGFSSNNKDYQVIEVFEKKDIRVEAREVNLVVELGTAEFKKEEGKLGGGWKSRDGFTYEGYVCKIYQNGQLIGTVDSGGKNVRTAAANYKPEKEE
ncbi:MAG: hypothetical protein U1E27_03600 [Kiritimatiellia bacterium]|nr:hypothetical protein [Kiritimatiellia bacterium]